MYLKLEVRTTNSEGKELTRYARSLDPQSEEQAIQETCEQFAVPKENVRVIGRYMAQALDDMVSLATHRCISLDRLPN